MTLLGSGEKGCPALPWHQTWPVRTGAQNFSLLRKMVHTCARLFTRIAQAGTLVNSHLSTGCKQELSVRLKPGHLRILQGQKTANSCAKWAKVALELRVERSSKCDMTCRNQAIIFMLTLLTTLACTPQGDRKGRPYRRVPPMTTHGRPQWHPRATARVAPTGGCPQ